MRVQRLMIRLVVVLSVCLAAGSAIFAQQAPRGDDVVRINTDLVQTDVMVFAKDGSFVDRLKREQFELKVDARPREVSFFERVAAGSRNEEAQLAAARGARISASGAPVPLDRGRTVFFYLDDLHLSQSSVVYVRAMLTRFVDHQMGQNDEAAIFSTSDQIGFLQQLTDNKAVLHAAIERIRSFPGETRDGQRPAMSEYHALLIDQKDQDIIDFFIDQILKDNPGLPRQIAGDMVRQRAEAILQQGNNFTLRALEGLANLSRSVGQLSGRKLLVLVSDGFLIDSRNSTTADRIRRITSAAARSGVVIYSIDARGLVVGGPDASSEGVVDPTGRLARASFGEVGASQDGLNALARDTGGRALFNTNDLSASVATAVNETSVYYLLAWRPENEEERVGRFKRIEVSVIGRPELSVRLRRNYGEPPAPRETAQRKTVTLKDKPKPPPDELRESLLAAYPKVALATSVAVSFMDLPSQGSVLTASMRIAVDADQFSVVDGKPVASFAIGGLVVNDKGKVVSSFRERLTIKGTATDVELSSVDSLFYNYRAKVTPGLYQIRVASRDEKTGRNGSAMKWIEIPDLTSHHLTLSSIMAGERTLDLQRLSSASQGQEDTTTDAFRRVRLNVDHRFARSSRLRFLVFAYNAANSDTTGAVAPGQESPPGLRPDVAVQVQVLRDNEPVFTTTLRKIDTEGVSDLARLPYAADVPLEGLPAGHYLLRVTIIDRIARTSATQQLGFQVD